MRRPLRVALTLLVTGLCTAYLVWKIDLSKTIDVLTDTNPNYFLLAITFVVVTVPPIT